MHLTMSQAAVARERKEKRKVAEEQSNITGGRERKYTDRYICMCILKSM